MEESFVGEDKGGVGCEYQDLFADGQAQDYDSLGQARLRKAFG